MRKIVIAAGLGIAGVAAALVAGVASANEGTTLGPTVTATATATVVQTPADMSKWTPGQFTAMQFAEKNLYNKLGTTTLVSSTETSTPKLYEVVLTDAKGATWKALVQLNDRNGASFVSVDRL